MARQVIGTRGESITTTLLNGHSFKLTFKDLLLYWYISAISTLSEKFLSLADSD